MIRQSETSVAELKVADIVPSTSPIENDNVIPTEPTPEVPAQESEAALQSMTATTSQTTQNVRLKDFRL